MWNELINRVRPFCQNSKSIEIAQLNKMMISCQEFISGLSLTESEAPYGRYLIHKEESFNIQLDVFSDSYTGSIHNHNTWGAFFILRGQLLAEDWDFKDNRFISQRSAIFGTGSSQCFGPPHSDWHRVSTPSLGHQTVSIHIYGSDFNLDSGQYLNDQMEVITTNRSPFKDMKNLQQIFYS